MGGTVQSTGQFAAQNPDLLLRLGAQALNPRIRPVAQIGAGLWEQSLFPQRAKDWLSAQMAVEAQKAGKTSPIGDPSDPGGLGGTVPVRATEEQQMRAMVPPRGQGAAAAATVGDIAKSREEAEEQRRREREAAMRPLGAPQVVTMMPAPSARAPLARLGQRQQLTIEDLVRLLMQWQGLTRG